VHKIPKIGHASAFPLTLTEEQQRSPIDTSAMENFHDTMETFWKLALFPLQEMFAHAVRVQL
jgi:hypothetical protein